MGLDLGCSVALNDRVPLTRTKPTKLPSALPSPPDLDNAGSVLSECKGLVVWITPSSHLVALTLPKKKGILKLWRSVNEFSLSSSSWLLPKANRTPLTPFLL
ncbi:hypothetical protein QQF64_011184 [Cirrhinus molitorella]|uniref:Uncharacterized protein n=1 Tax=Cirrhinus molitorella TaxID=172907 RepID=A0ABR3LZF9_9TELE